MSIEYVLWGRPAGETDALHDVVLLSNCSKKRIEEVKAWATADGFHSFTVQELDTTADVTGMFRKATR